MNVRAPIRGGGLKGKGDSAVDTVVEHRRKLHQIPELDHDLPKTTGYVCSVLEPLRCTLSRPIPGGVCAFFDAGKPETVAFRADMDALPETEKTGLAFASRHQGRMHACGHDGHTAVALALAEYASDCLNHMPRNALFLFQPSEETTGGAKLLCEMGLLTQHNVCRVFGLHLWPGLPEGTVWTRPGPQMARSSEVSIYITGKSVHFSHAEQGRDALLAAAELLEKTDEMTRSVLTSEHPVVLRFGKLVSGDARNVISGHSELLGSLRSFVDEDFDRLCRGLRRVCRQVERETGCGVALHISQGYPPVYNHKELYDEVCRRLGGGAPSLLKAPVLASEDFSFYQRHAPGVFFFLGAGDVPPLHAPNFTFDDETVLPKGVEFMKRLLMMA